MTPVLLRRLRTAPVLLALWGALGAAQAHVVIQERSVVQGAYHRAAFQVGHGCAGSPTTELAVTVPPGAEGVRPMPKAGWQLDIEAPAADGSRRIVWRGGSLDDRHYDEFVMQFKVTAAPGPLWFNVEQTCAQGRNLWVERPASGHSTRGLRLPAALLEVVPAAPSGHAHHH